MIRCAQLLTCSCVAVVVVVHIYDIGGSPSLAVAATTTGSEWCLRFWREDQTLASLEGLVVLRPR